MSGQRNRGQRNRRQPHRRTIGHGKHGPSSAATLQCRAQCVHSDSGFHALIHLDSGRAVSVRPGQPAQITSPSLPGLRVTGEVLSVAPTTRARYLVTITVTGTHPDLRHGLPIDVQIITRTKTDVLVIPNSAVIRDGENFFVEVLERDGQHRRVQFTPGMIGHDTTEVLCGLSEGQEVFLEASQSRAHPE